MSAIINLAIIAHVDHGKTTLTDEILKQSDVFRDASGAGELIMDSGDQEKERGITITAKNCAVKLASGTKLNIIDTPGHSDFGSEVERVLGMADGCLLIVDAFEGPMPQTRFVLQHALKRKLKIIVVFNKIDKPNIDKDHAINKVFDLFIDLGASDEQCDFSYLFAIGKDGKVGKECDVAKLSNNLDPLFEMIEEQIIPCKHNEGKSQIQISSLDYDSYLGRIAIGRVNRGTIQTNQPLLYEDIKWETKNGRVQKLFTWSGISRIPIEEAVSHDIVGISWFPDITIGDTLCADEVDSLDRGVIEEPTLEVMIYPNSSPVAGREGKFVTSQNIADRLERELETNVGLRVTVENEKFRLAGRGELHIGVLLENMRREWYELAVGKPQVLFNEKGEEPYEEVFIDVPEDKMGSVIEQLGKRKGEMKSMDSKNGRSYLQYLIPTRGLLGFRNQFIILTNGEGILTSGFHSFGPKIAEIKNIRNGAMMSQAKGDCTAYSLWNLQERATLFVDAGAPVYEGQIIGECSKQGELVVNPTKGKQLTNVRASGTDEAVKLTPCRKLTLEQCLEWIEEDELLEITPISLRLRKKYLTEIDRKRYGRGKSEK